MSDTDHYLGKRIRRASARGFALFAAILALALPVAGNTQETTSAIRGKVLGPNGGPVAEAGVTVEDLRSGTTRSYTSNADGLFLATRLLPGGPYRVTVNGTKTVDVPLISVGDTYSLIVNLQQEASIEEIVTIGQAGSMVEVAAGPAATFSLDDLESAVAFSRDISDVYGIDPRLMIDNDEDGFGVNCAGKHPRFNNITLDGVSQSDRFGLNENGYATAVGQPFPYDALEQVAVELAPFDVTYGGFSACNINAVTKSGTNEWEGKVFYEYSDDGLRGDTVADDDADYSSPVSYDKTYYGFSVGGPILQDRLFIFGAYAKSETPRFLARGYAGSGNGDERDWLSQADYDRINSIAQSVYAYDPGGQPGDGLQEDEKWLVRLDWNVTDSHTASLIYNYYDGYQLRDSDGDANEFEFANHFYTKGAEFEVFTAKLNSWWSDIFSTEISYSSTEMNDSQVTVGPKDFADMQISIGSNTVYMGADDSRQANSLSNESEYFKLSGQLFLGDHVITAGYEREELDIFNIFVQHSNGGEYDFFDDSSGNPASCAALDAAGRLADPSCGLSGIDKFELGRPSRIYYGSGGGTNDPNDAAAIFGNTQNTLYIQDEMFFDNLDLTIVAGLRYDWYETSDAPTYNQAFFDANGFRNDATIDGVDLIQPRLGFTWGVSNDVTLRGGVGLYSGGNPNVWISNSYSNDGLTNAQFTLANFDSSATVLPGMADSLVLSGQGRPGFDVPQELVDDVAAVTPADANDSFLAIIDPDYEQPREWKFALGATWDSPWWDITFDVDYLYSRAERPVFYEDVSQDVVGQTIIGTPIYDYVRGEDNFMLTNSDESPRSHVISLVAQKSFDWGLDVLFGYAYTDSEDVSPMTSSVAQSNFSNTALIDINDPAAGTSNYLVPHRFTLRLDYERAFFGDNLTRFTLFGYANEGQPQSYGMSSADLEGDGFFGRHLLYVPSGPNDPNVVFDAGFDQQAFFDWVNSEGLSPGLTSRNDRFADWSQRWDLRISQDIPLPVGLTGRIYLKVFNIGNLLNDDWGKVTDAVFFTPVFVDADVNPVTGQFIYNEFSTPDMETTIINSSLWEARLGFDIRFGGG